MRRLPLLFFIIILSGIPGGSRVLPYDSSSGNQATASFSIIVYPNPYRPNDGRDETGTPSTPITFRGAPAGATLRIFDAAGRSVFDTVSGGGDLRWFATNKRGRPLASGVYIYVIDAGSKSERVTGRIGRVR